MDAILLADSETGNFWKNFWLSEENFTLLGIINGSWKKHKRSYYLRYKIDLHKIQPQKVEVIDFRRNQLQTQKLSKIAGRY